jgi:hypothetical protein
MWLVARALVVLVVLLVLVADRLGGQEVTTRSVMVPDAQVLSISSDGK